jgi:hypothetical protein
LNLKEKEMLKFKHSGNAGDVIYSLNAIKKACEINETTAVLYLHLNQPLKGNIQNHPVGSVMLNEYMYKNLKPLLMSCEFISDVMPYNGQKLDYNLDNFRTNGFHLGAGDIKRWYYHSYPELTFDIEGPLFSSYKPKEDFLLINRTNRYQNGQIDYSIFNDYSNQLLFAGTKDEFEVMKKTLNKLEYLKVKDFNELKDYIAASKVFIGNQSMCFAIAEQLQTERILEVCFHCPNVIPNGGDFYDVFNQQGLQYAINQLI